MDEDIKITLSKEKKKGAVLKVIGVGGAGGNAINRMIEEDMQGVEFIAVNTDIQDLAEIKEPAMTIQIGEKITRGLGAGSNPEIGEQAALEDTDTLIEALEAANMVFITAGMGGGTGTGASHIIANHASSMGILTVGVVTKPFHFERDKRMKVADEGIRKLKESVDAIIVIPNQKLLELVLPDMTLDNAYRKADDVLLQAVRGISDMINNKGYQNVDFADVKTTMLNKGITLMGTGEANGENRAEEATRKALNSPLLDNVSINGATGILYNITASTNLTLAEISRISELITANADPDATIKFGVVKDDRLTDTLRVTVIATGFKEISFDRSVAKTKAHTSPIQSQSQTQSQPYRRPTDPGFTFAPPATPSAADISGYINERSFPSMTHSPEEFDDEIDIPTFQRLNIFKRKEK